MEPTQELIDDLFRERVLRARQMSAEEKLLAPAELFAWACEIARSGIRYQHPEADEAQIEELLAQRLALGERLRKAR